MAMNETDHPTWCSLLDSVVPDNYSAAKDAADARQRAALVLGSLYCQVLNGGLEQWVENGYANDDGVEVMELLEQIGTSAALEVLECVRVVLSFVDLSVESSGYGANYWLELDGDMPAGLDVVDEKTDRFYRHSDDLARDVEVWLKLFPENLGK